MGNGSRCAILMFRAMLDLNMRLLSRNHLRKMNLPLLHNSHRKLRRLVKISIVSVVLEETQQQQSPWRKMHRLPRRQFGAF